MRRYAHMEEEPMSRDILIHHGIKGMRWGVRRYQNPDGSLTDAGKRRYKINADGSVQKLSRSEKRAVRQEQRERRREELAKAEAAEKERVARVRKQSVDDYISDREQKPLSRMTARAMMEDTRSKADKEFRRSKEGKDLYEEWDRHYDLVDGLTQARKQLDDAKDPASVATKDYLDSRIAEERKAFDAVARRTAEARGQYVCSRMVKEYGDTGLERFMTDSWFVTKRNDGESVLDWYIRDVYDYYKWEED